MIGATFFATAPVLADQTRVGSTTNLPVNSWLDKKASDENILTRSCRSESLVQLKLLKVLKQKRRVVGSRKEKSEKPSNLPKELEDKLGKAETMGVKLTKDQLAQDTGKLVPEDVMRLPMGN